MVDKDKKADVIESLLAEMREKVREDIPIEDIEPEGLMEPEIMRLGEDFGPSAIEKAEEEAEEERDRLIREALAKEAQEEEARKAAEKEKEREAKEVRKKANKKVTKEALEKVMARNKAVQKLKKKTGYPTGLEKLAVFAAGSVPGLLLGTFDRMKEFESAERALDKELGLAAAKAKTEKVKLATVPDGERTMMTRGLDIIKRRTMDNSLQQGWQKGFLPDGFSLGETIMGFQSLADTVLFERPPLGADQTSEAYKRWQVARVTVASIAHRLVKLESGFAKDEEDLHLAEIREVENLARDGRDIKQFTDWAGLTPAKQRGLAARFKSIQLDVMDDADAKDDTVEGAFIAAKASEALAQGLRGEPLPEGFFDGVDKKHFPRLQSKYDSGVAQSQTLTGNDLKKRLDAADGKLAETAGRLAAYSDKTLADNPHASDDDKLVAAKGKEEGYKLWNIGFNDQKLRDLAQNNDREWTKKQSLYAATRKSAEKRGGFAAYSPDKQLKDNPFKDETNREAWTTGFLEARTGIEEGRTKADYAKANAGEAFDGQINKAYKSSHFGNEIDPAVLDALKGSTTPWQAHANKLGELRELLYMQQQYNRLFDVPLSAKAAARFGLHKFNPLESPKDGTVAALWSNTRFLVDSIRSVLTETGSMVRSEASEAAATHEDAPYK